MAGVSHDDDKTSPGIRRVIKATAPPPSTVDSDKVTLPVPQADDDIPHEHNMVPPIYANSLLHETQGELKEKRRLQRLEASTAVRRQHRDEDHEERRRGSTKVGTPHNKQPAVTDNHESGFNFTVEPQFPEHKRNVQEASLPRTRPFEEPQDKRHRVDDDETEEEAPAGFPWNKIALAAAVCVIAIVAERLLRRK